MADIFSLFKQIEKKEPQGAPTHMVVGLGNPGREYALTRHNAGFMALDYIAKRASVTVDRAKFHALYGLCDIDGKRVILLFPQTYMNNSGEAVRECASFYKIPTENIIVFSDDINLPVGRMRVRRSGSDGGQKGLASIIYHLNSDKFPRIRIGVGAPSGERAERGDLADWVVGRLSESDREIISELMGTAYDGLRRLLSGDVDGAMQLCNSVNLGGK